MNRFYAALIHLLASVAAGASLFATFWFVWYPAPLFWTSGALPVFLTLVVVDVILGPVLTFVVYKPGKPSLVFDLSVIVAVQALALTYGVWALFEGRPVYVAALGHRFDVVHANEVSAADLAVAGTSLPLTGPQWVGIKEATDPKERERVFSSALSGIDYGHMPQHHAPISSMRARLLARAEPIADLRVRNPGRADHIDDWVRVHGINEKDVVFLGLKDRAADAAVILDAKTAEVIGIAPFKPWD